MTHNPRNIVLLPHNLPPAWGLTVQAAAERIRAWQNVAETRIVTRWTTEEIGSTGPGDRFFLVGRAEPLADLTGPDVRQFPVDLSTLMPWLAGDPSINLLALLKAEIEAADLGQTGEPVSLNPYPKVLVLGHGAAAEATIARLGQDGLETVWARTGHDISSFGSPPHPDNEKNTNLEILPCRQPLGIQGFAGRFAVRIETGDSIQEVWAGAVIICGAEEKIERIPESFRGLSIQTLSDFEAELFHGDSPDRTVQRDHLKIAFLTGLGRATSTSAMRRILTSSIKLAAETQADVYVLAPQVKVAEYGLERLYGRARDSGVTFIRLPEAGPEILSDPNHRPKFKVFDPLVQGHLILSPDLIVWDESSGLREDLTRWAEAFDLLSGSDRGLGPDNVLFLPSLTNRRGIMSLGPARGTDSGEIQTLEIETAVVEAQRFLTAGMELPQVIWWTGLCSRCLTCLRACPHGAVTFTDRPWFHPQACLACGICAAVCPGQAIDLIDSTDAQLKVRLDVLMARPREADRPRPRLVVFGCRRSAQIALRSAPPPEKPVDLIFAPLPCGGRLDERLVLEVLGQGVDGVMAAVCHPDNCRTQKGGLMADRRVSHIKTVIKSAGFDPRRLKFITLAPNMGLEFTRAVDTFTAELARPGADGA